VCIYYFILIYFKKTAENVILIGNSWTMPSLRDVRSRRREWSKAKNVKHILCAPSLGAQLILNVKCKRPLLASIFVIIGGLTTPLGLCIIPVVTTPLWRLSMSTTMLSLIFKCATCT